MLELWKLEPHEVRPALDAAWTGRAYEWKDGVAKHKQVTVRVVRLGKNRWSWCAVRPFEGRMIAQAESYSRTPEEALQGLAAWTRDVLPKKREYWDMLLNQTAVFVCARRGW
jgi:hypothetical protein